MTLCDSLEATFAASDPDAVDWPEVTRLLETLYASVDRLERLFPGRKFTLDGHHQRSDRA